MRDAIQFFQALADETRWRLLLLLWDEPLCVCELADVLGMPQSSVSSHVQVIKKAGLLDSERREKWVYYQVARAHLPLLDAVRKHFGLAPSSMHVLARDVKRMEKRLAARDESCCPQPRQLTSRSLKRPATRKISRSKS